jgi:Fe-S-cluster containining protein
MRSDELQHALGEVRAVYAELAQRPLARSCRARAGCCRFRLTGLTPQLTKGEALVAARGLRATGRRELPESADGDCPLLKRETGRCLIYADRPFGCRTHFRANRSSTSSADWRKWTGVWMATARAKFKPLLRTSWAGSGEVQTGRSRAGRS